MSGYEGAAVPENEQFAALDEASLLKIRRCRTCLGQGLGGLETLKRTVREARGADWVRHIPIGDGVQTANLPCCRYLLERAKVETLNMATNGYTPVQRAVVWGKTNMLVYLLSVGADPIYQGKSLLDMARLRQERLQRAFDDASEGVEFEGVSITRSQIAPLIEEGREMVEILVGVETHGSFSNWAQHNGANPLVKRFAVKRKTAEPRYRLAVLRSLIVTDRATVLPEEKRAAILAEEAAQAAARAREERSLWDVLLDEGFPRDATRAICDKFKKSCIRELRSAQFSPEAIEAGLEVYVRQGVMTEGDKRKFLRFVRELDEPSPEKTQPVAAKSKAAVKPKAKAPAPAAKAALLAMAGKSAKGSASNTTSASKTKRSSVHDGFPLLFHVDLPSNAFMLITCFLHGI